MPEPALRLLIVDDHALFRQSVARYLAAEPGFVVAGHCGSIAEALARLESAAPDVVLLDFDLGDEDGRDFLRRARERGFAGKILVVTAGVDDRASADLMRSGASGIFQKHETPELLAQSIRDVAAGKVWLRQSQLASVLQRVSAPAAAEIAPFTERERQVLQGVFDGHSNKEIGARLGISEGTVKIALQQLFSKTGVRTRSQLVRIVLERFSDQL